MKGTVRVGQGINETRDAVRNLMDQKCYFGIKYDNFLVRTPGLILSMSS